MSEFISVYDFAQLAGCSTRCVLRLVRRGVLQASRHHQGRKLWLNRAHSLAYLENRKRLAVLAAKKAKAHEQIQKEFFDQLFDE